MHKIWGITGFNRLAMMEEDAGGGGGGGDAAAALAAAEAAKAAAGGSDADKAAADKAAADKVAADKVAADKLAATDPVKVEEARVKALTDARAANAPKEGKYADFKHLEGIAPDEAALKEFSAWAASKGMNQAEAQEAVAMQEKLEVARAQREGEAWTKVIEGWKNELKADREYGGDKVDATKALARDTLLKVGGQKLVDTIDALNLSDNPPLILAWAKMGKLMSEAKIDPAKLTPAGSGAVKFGDEGFYNNSQPQS